MVKYGPLKREELFEIWQLFVWEYCLTRRAEKELFRVKVRQILKWRRKVIGVKVMMRGWVVRWAFFSFSGSLTVSPFGQRRDWVSLFDKFCQFLQIYTTSINWTLTPIVDGCYQDFFWLLFFVAEFQLFIKWVDIWTILRLEKVQEKRNLWINKDGT